jgi:uncharacterized protein YgiM (DUF1202 family)
MKKTLKLLLILIIAFLSFTTSNVKAATRYTYYITGDGVRVRSTPKNADNIIGKLNYGDIIDVVSFDNSWYKIRYGNGYGYVTYRYVSKIEDSYSSKTIALLKSSTSLKKSNSSSSSTLATIPKSGVVIVLKEKSGWAYVHYNEKTGYVKTSALKKYVNKKELAVGVYTISYSYSNSSRKSNITMASKKINQVSIKNGAKFSFISKVGKKGYYSAPEFKNTSKVNGGGLSQLASTIYLAVRDAQRNNYHINVTEQNRYGSKTPYAKLGEEAIINLASNKDLVFTNKTGKTMRIYSRVDGYTISIVVSVVL